MSGVDSGNKGLGGEREKLLTLEKRLDGIEERVFGCLDKDIDYPKDTPQVIDTLHTVNSQINASVAKRPNIEAMFKRIPELSQYLESDYVDRLTVAPETKLNVILSEEDTIRDQAAMLEKVQGLTAVLDSEHIKAVPTYQSRLHDLSHIHLQQQDKVVELTDDTSDLLTRYNNIITLLSKQFVMWDSVVTQLEVAAQHKPTDD